jgi:xanthine dehydrogenase accessory factor
MEDLFEQIDALVAHEKRVAMATLVATRGTSPKREGAKMFVSEAGRILGSVTIGGCVDARVIEESERALADSTPRVLTMSLGEEDAWEGGFTCAGTVQILVEPLDLSSNDGLFDLYRLVESEVLNGRRAVLATPLAESSAKLIVLETGRSIGTLGDLALDRVATERAIELMHKRTSRTLEIEAGAKSSEIFFEVHAPAQTLIVFGAVHVAMHLVNLARELGFRTIVVDGRPRFATRERFPRADELLIGIPSEIASQLSYNSSTLVVLVAHDYKYDIPVLKAVLGSDAAYIGLLGSRKRGRAILDFLRESGIDELQLARVRVPTGLDIGAETAAEIALSILSEAVAVKAGRAGSSLSDRK